MAPPLPDYQAFTVEANGISNQILTPVVVFPAFDPKTTATPPDGHQAMALWDTGATRSVISPAVASALSLTAVGAMNVSHAGGTSVSPTYMVNLALPNRVGVVGVLVSEFPGMSGFEVIVGMDIICRGDLALTHVDGKTCMSFRMPSCAKVDFVANAERLKYAGTGRNDPCPCGATDAQGKPVKFKKCHGPKVRA